MDLIEYKLIREQSFRRHPWERTRKRFLLYLLSRMPFQRNIADTGSGDGYLAAAVARRYPSARVTAIDINYSDELLEELSSTTPANLYFTRNIEDIPEAPPADAVVLMDVLEHVQNPDKLLKSILHLKSMNPDTRLIITVPAYQQLYSIHDKNLGHYRRYNLKQLEELTTSLSLRTEHSGYFFNSLLPIRFIMKMTEKMNPGKPDSIHNWKGGAVITSLLSGWFWIEFKITWYLARIGIKIPGLTCYCICRYAP